MSKESATILECGLSPCPNDVYLFGGWLLDQIEAPFPLKTRLADIEELNRFALANRFQFSKVSAHCLPTLLPHYRLLPVGATLGFGCGPKLISSKPISLEEIPNLRLALPGEQTTAHLLTQLLLPAPARKIFCRYDSIPSLLHSGGADAGVIIHETRFTFRQAGLHEIADLGTLWEKETHCPLPLGCLVAAREVPEPTVAAFCSAVQRSYDWAQEHRLKLDPLLLQHSQEKLPSVIDSHIALYITAETRALTEMGQRAFQTLFDWSFERGLLPHRIASCLA